MKREVERSFRYAQIVQLREKLSELQYASSTASTPYEAHETAIEILRLSREIQELEKQDR